MFGNKSSKMNVFLPSTSTTYPILSLLTQDMLHAWYRSFLLHLDVGYTKMLHFPVFDQIKISEM